MGENVFLGFEEHLYFGLTDDIMGLVHSDHATAVPGYESTALENNYFIKTGKISQWSEPFVDNIKQKLSEGQEKFTLPVSSSFPPGYKNVIYNLVAYQLSKENWTDTTLSVVYLPEQEELLCMDLTKVTPISEINLNKSQMNLIKGEKDTLTATIEPEDTTESKVLSWSSSNDKVATVINGTVTAVSAGKATITAKEENGKRAVCKITVTEKRITKVNLNQSQLTLTEGEKGTLTAAIEPADTTDDKTLSWSSDNTKAATVINGTVTAVSAGEATITAKAGNGKSASCKITVTRKAKPITKLSLNQSQLTLTEGGKGTLAATIEPADTTDSRMLSWSSSNTNVATVTNGVVTAVSAGEATITAKTSNGKSASCKVTVNKKETNTPEPPANIGTESPKPETPQPPADTGTDNQEPDNTPPRIFPDVNSEDWYQESADFVSSRGIMTGMSDGRFGPSEKLSRAQFATILHRMAGRPEPAYNLEPFPDVPGGQFYTVASIWAKETGVISESRWRL